MRHANTTVAVAAWQPVLAGWEAVNETVCAAQPRYMLCTLTRERHLDNASLFRLVSEHDNRVLLVARQRWPGEGDFLIYAPPDEADNGVVAGDEAEDNETTEEAAAQLESV